MRISDWSSDVCSSDLCIYAIRTHLCAILRHSHRHFHLHIHCRKGERNALAVARAKRIFSMSSSMKHHHKHSETVRVWPITDRKSVVEGKSVSGRVDLGGSRILKKKIKGTHNNT